MRQQWLRYTQVWTCRQITRLGSELVGGYTALRVAVHVGAWWPLLRLTWDAVRGGLSVNPIQDALVRTGQAALVLLMLSLSCTPLNTVLRFRNALRVRRALGLYAFLYATLHLATFALLDYGLDLGLIAQAVAEKYYIVAGFIGFALLVPLAATSTRSWQVRLGRRWKQLHRLAYVAAGLGVLHFALLTKSLLIRPDALVFAAVLAVLMVLRLPAVRRRLSAQ